MENIIFNELRIRGFHVDAGMVEQRTTNTEGRSDRRQYEVDFVANLGSKRYYIQSAFMMPTTEKVEQESASLRHINDSFKKIIIVKEHIMPTHNDDGILMLSLFDFLLKPECLDW
jgi:predicted AAA+ superfamily ATPase